MELPRHQRPSAPSSEPKAPRWREHTEIRSTGTVAAPAPSDRRIPPPSPRLSRCCTTPKAVQLGRGLYAAASCRRPSGWRELPGSEAPARLDRLRPLTVECPHRLPGCPGAVPRPEPLCWAVGPSASSSRRPSGWREPTEIRSTGKADPFSLSGCGPLTSWICPYKSDACQDNSARRELTSKEDRESSQVGQLPILCYSFR